MKNKNSIFDWLLSFWRSPQKKSVDSIKSGIDVVGDLKTDSSISGVVSESSVSNSSVSFSAPKDKALADSAVPVDADGYYSPPNDGQVHIDPRESIPGGFEKYPNRPGPKDKALADSAVPVDADGYYSPPNDGQVHIDPRESIPGGFEKYPNRPGPKDKALADSAVPVDADGYYSPPNDGQVHIDPRESIPGGFEKYPNRPGPKDNPAVPVDGGLSNNNSGDDDPRNPFRPAMPAPGAGQNNANQDHPYKMLDDQVNASGGSVDAHNNDQYKLNETIVSSNSNSVTNQSTHFGITDIGVKNDLIPKTGTSDIVGLGGFDATTGSNIKD